MLYLPSVFCPQIVDKHQDKMPIELKRYINRHVANHLLFNGYKKAAYELVLKYKLRVF